MFEDDKLYLANDAALRPLGSYMTLAHWRNEGRGPAYIKLGRRVAYSGRTLNEWLRSRTVQPTGEDAPCGPARLR